MFSMGSEVRVIVSVSSVVPGVSEEVDEFHNAKANTDGSSSFSTCPILLLIDDDDDGDDDGDDEADQ
jgi:hypothetical protein